MKKGKLMKFFPSFTTEADLTAMKRIMRTYSERQVTELKRFNIFLSHTKFGSSPQKINVITELIKAIKRLVLPQLTSFEMCMY